MAEDLLARMRGFQGRKNKFFLMITRCRNWKYVTALKLAICTMTDIALLPWQEEQGVLSRLASASS